MSREEITQLVKTDPRYTIAALVAIHSFQLEDEKYSARYQNGKGFNGTDAGICGDLVDFYRQRGFLTPRQLAYLQRSLPKYMGQIAGMDLEPATIKSIEKPTANVDPANPAAPTNTKQAKMVGDLIQITFPYDAVMVGLVKTLSERRWDAVKKVWMATPCPATIDKLREWGFQLDPSIAVWMEALTPTVKVEVTEVVGLKRQLFPYQLEGVQFIESRNGRALVGDEMGLGKTAQALSWLQLHPEARPAIIVCPASLKLNWAREAEMWMSSPKYQVINGRPNGTPLTGEIIIINYDICSDWMERLVAYKPKVVVTDECHYYKNSKAIRTKAIKTLAKGVPHFIALSGTPIVNRPNEMFNAISCVQPKLFPSYFKFAQRYCGAVHNGFGWDFGGASNTEELHRILTDTVMIRRKKADVLKDLPPKMRNVVPMELDNQKDYSRAEADFIRWLREEFGKAKADAAKRAEALVRIESLKQLAVAGKMREATEWIQDFLETGEKLVVFAVHKNVIDSVMKAFPGAVKVDGSCSQEERQKAVDRFQNDPTCRLFVGNIKAAGVGLTLTKSSNTCFLELGWTPGDHDQAEDRVHRIGQESDSVNAWYLLASSTIEEEIAKLIDRKRAVLAKVLDGEEITEESMLSELLTKYGKE